MATGNKRDVRLAVEIDTVGEESLRRAGDELKRLAKEGGAAAPELAALAAQFDKLADQSGALATFRQLGTEVDKLKAAQTEAAVAAGALGDRLAAAAADAKPLADRQRELTESTLTARKANADLAAGMLELGARVKANTASQDEYDAALVAGKKTRADNVALIASNTLELAKQRPALEAAVAAEEKLRRQYETQQAEVARVNQALRQRETALKGASDAALAAGAATTDLAASEADLLRATQETVGATRRLAGEQEKAALAARLADAEFAKNVTTLRELDAAARALDDADSAAAMQKLEQGAREADAQFDKLVASLRAAEGAAEEYAAATARAAGASRDDTQALQARQAAAQRLLDADRALNAEQREAIAVRSAGRAAILAEAQALLKLAADARESLAASEAAVQGARRAGAALESAFGATGIRSIDAIEQEIKQTSVALERLQKEAREGAIGLDDLNRAAGAAEAKIERLRAEIAQVQAAPGTFERLSTGLNDLVTRFGALTAVIATVGVAVRPVLDATIALDQMRRVLTTVTGSSEVAEQQIAKLRITAQQAGVSFTEVGQSYAKFAASALQSGLTLDQVNSAFDAVALAAGNLGLSSDQAKRALEALSQIASKGTVSMEELRQQLGDALPGVLPLLAKELGLTQRELLKVVESGGLLASEGIPAIDRALRQLGPASGQVEGLVASFNRFKNVVLEAGTALVNGPLGTLLGGTLSYVADVLKLVALAAVGASEAMRLLGFSVVAVVDALTPGGEKIKDVGKKIQDMALESGARLDAFQKIAFDTGKTTESLAGKLGFTGESFAKLTLEQQKSIEAAALAAQSAEKNVQAAKAQADALTRTVGLLGDETAAREASATAANLVLRATEDQLAADRALLASYESQKQAVLEQVRLGKQTIENVKALTEDIDKNIEKKTADVAKTLAQADAARAFALAQELVVKSAGDQSKSLDELRKSVDAAASAQILASRRYAEGKGSLDALTRTTDALASAKGLLRDAINDLDSALKQEIATLKADNEIKRAGLELELAQARNLQRLAQERGEETKARQIGIRIAEIEQVVRRESSSATLQEAEATLKNLDTKEKELRAQGLLTPEIQKEIELKRKAEIATILKTQAQIENNREADRQLDRAKGLLPALDGVTGATDANTRSTDTNTKAKNANADASDRQAKSADAAHQALLRGDPSRLVGGNGLAGIGPSQDGVNFGIRSPGQGNAAFESTPFQSGSSASSGAKAPVRQGGSFYTPPPDESGDWEWVSKFGGGGEWVLSDAGYANQAKRQGQEALQRALAAGQSDYFDPVTQRRVSTGVAEAREAQMRAGFEASLARTPTASAPNSGSYTVNVTIGGKNYGIAAGNRASADALIAALEEAYRAGGGG